MVGFFMPAQTVTQEKVMTETKNWQAQTRMVHEGQEARPLARRQKRFISLGLCL